MKKGQKVNVYTDPYTVSDLEGRAVITSDPTETGDDDVKGRPMYRCMVRFTSEPAHYFRTVSEPA